MVSGLIDISPAVSPEEQAFDDEIAQNEEEGQKGKCFNSVLLATLSTHGDASSAPMMAPSLSGEDKGREPEIAEDEMQRGQMASILGQAWGEHSNEVYHHCYDSNDFDVDDINTAV